MVEPTRSRTPSVVAIVVAVLGLVGWGVLALAMASTPDGQYNGLVSLFTFFSGLFVIAGIVIGVLALVLALAGRRRAPRAVGPSRSSSPWHPCS